MTLTQSGQRNIPDRKQAAHLCRVLEMKQLFSVRGGTRTLTTRLQLDL
jgi:hypothetical protein